MTDESTDILSLSLAELYLSESQAIFDQRAQVMYRLDVQIIRRLESEMKQLVVKVGDQVVTLSLYELSLLWTLREDGAIDRVRCIRACGKSSQTSVIVPLFLHQSGPCYRVCFAICASMG